MKSHSDTKGTLQGYESEHGLDIAHKSAEIDFATAVDILNEKVISDGIKKAFPSHTIIGEETVGTGEVPPLGSSPTWIVDPIDGTTNFASGQPLTAVSIGLCDGGRPVLGVAFAPITGELYLAITGRGAFRNGVRIHSTNQTSVSIKRLSDAVVCCEFGYARSDQAVRDMVGAAEHILQHGCRTLRQLGSGVLDICYVASGRIDVVYTGVADEGWKPWDYCAAMVVAEESGCTIRSLKGAPGKIDASDEFDKDGQVVQGSSFNIYSKSMICGVNKTIVEECRKTVLG
mmetsp:Transcript_26450/g.78248  ORF Transcript_26450/g.78248 Transcript_26450/m.78248 type:complete len:287 (+) Transcript_26450:284-1144(+)